MAECEDRIVWKRSEGPDGEFRAAVADGASASFLAEVWAELLANGYCESPHRTTTADGLAALGEEWQRIAGAQALPWYAAAKRDSGAHATLLGVVLGADGGWAADAIGDSCLFLVRDSCLVTAFPIRRASDFGRMPVLAGTTVGTWSEALVCHEEGTWQNADDIYLMTDALAEWTLNEIEADRAPWPWLHALESPGNPLAFDAWINDLRERGRLRDDDVALLHVQLDARAGGA